MQAQNRINTYIKNKRQLRTKNINSIAENSGYSKKFLAGLLTRKQIDDFNRAKRLLSYKNKPSAHDIFNENMPFVNNKILSMNISKDDNTHNTVTNNNYRDIKSGHISRSMSFSMNNNSINAPLIKSNRNDLSSQMEGTKSTFFNTFRNSVEFKVKGAKIKDPNATGKAGKKHDENQSKNDMDLSEVNLSLMVHSKDHSQIEPKTNFIFFNRNDTLAVRKEMKTVHSLNKFGILKKQEKTIREILKEKRLIRLNE